MTEIDTARLRALAHWMQAYLEGLVDPSQADEKIEELSCAVELLLNRIATLERAAADVEQEREACAKLCDEHGEHRTADMMRSRTVGGRTLYSAAAQTAHLLAGAIRSRGEQG